MTRAKPEMVQWNSLHNVFRYGMLLNGCGIFVSPLLPCFLPGHRCWGKRYHRRSKHQGRFFSENIEESGAGFREATSSLTRVVVGKCTWKLLPCNLHAYSFFCPVDCHEVTLTSGSGTVADKFLIRFYRISCIIVLALSCLSVSVSN